MENLDPKIIAAIISAIVSLVVVVLSFIFRSVFEKHFHLFKLQSEHTYDQRKQIKLILSKNKIRVLNISETLNHRFWNFSNNYVNKWHCLKDYDHLDGENYFVSFVYRFLAFFAWQQKLDKEMLFLDTTIASEQDLELIKFFRLFQQIMCDVKLFEGFDYDINVARDHFFNDNFEEMVSVVIHDDDIYSYAEFKDNLPNIINIILPLMSFLNGVLPSEDRYRWDKIQILHIALMTFINSYGYDFQYTNKEKLKGLAEKYKHNKLLKNFELLVNEYHLDKNKEVKNVINIFGKININYT